MRKLAWEDGTLPLVNTPLFLINLALTVGLVCLALWTGKRGKRPAHYVTVVVMIISLTGAIMQAELYGRSYSFISWLLYVHLTFATTCLLSVTPLVWTGWRLRTQPLARKAHKRCIRIFLALLGFTVLTACTMFLGAEKV